MNWKSITVGQFKIVDSIIQSDLSEDDKNIELVAQLFNYSEEEINLMPISKFAEKLNSIQFLRETPPTDKLPNYIFLNRKFYKVIKNLTDITAGQYADLKEYTKVKEDINSKLNLILTTFIVPCTWYGSPKKYNGERIPKQADDFDEMPMSIAYSLAVFFCNLFPQLIEATEIYMVQKAESELKKANKILKKQLEDLPTDGGGSTYSIRLRRNWVKQ